MLLHSPSNDESADCSRVMLATKGSVQLAGRKKPLRHLIALSEEFASSNVSVGSGRTLLASSENRCIWASLAHIHGIPGMPNWADWFAGRTGEGAVFPGSVGALKSGAIRFPVETASIHGPSLDQRQTFLPTKN